MGDVDDLLKVNTFERELWKLENNEKCYRKIIINNMCFVTCDPFHVPNYEMRNLKVSQLLERVFSCFVNLKMAL